MKNIRITFRLSPYQLARGLQTIRQLEPKYKLTGVNDIVKTIYFDYLSKMTMNRQDTISPSIVDEIKSFLDSPTKKQLTVAELININKTKLEPELEPDLEPLNEPEPDISDKILAEIQKVSNQTKASEFDDPNNTDSKISAVSDFSPPKDWMED